MIDKILEYVVSEGMKPYKVPLYDEEIYCGCLKGYVTSFGHTPGGWLLDISITFSSQEDEEAFKQYLDSLDIKKQYHIAQYTIDTTSICILWSCYPVPFDSTDFSSFVEWFFPLLKKYNVAGSNICSECGGKINDGRSHWYIMSGRAHVLHIHPKCKGTRLRKVQRANAFFKYKRLPSYASGTLGALIGTIPAIILWAFVLRYGDIAIPTGLLIGSLAWLGYTINIGFRGSLKPLILYGGTSISTLFGTVLGFFWGSFRSLPQDATDPSVLVFMSFMASCFMLAILCITEACYFAYLRRGGESGIIRLK